MADGATQSRGASIRRASWGVLDQALSSATNFALAVVLAHQLDIEDFGAVGLAFAVYLIALNASRAVSTEPLVVRFSAVPEQQWRPAAASAAGTAFIVGLVAAAGCIVGGLATKGVVSSAVFALAPIMPGLLLQDAWRFVFFSSRNPFSAFLNDLMWAVFLVPALLIVIVSGAREPALYVLAWGGAASVAAAIGAIQARMAPAVLRTAAWLRSQRALASRYLVEFLVLSGAAQARLLIVAAIADLAVVGALRGGQVLFGALHPLTYGLQLTVVPEAVAVGRRSSAALLRLTIALAAALVAVAVTFGLVAYWLPDAVGVAVFGNIWVDVRPTIPGQTLAIASSGAGLGALVGLRALAAAGRSMRARVVASGLATVGAVVGGLTGDAAMCSLWIGAGVALGSVVWWREYLLHRQDRPAPAATGPDPG